MRKVMVAVIVLLSAVLVLSPALAAGKGQGQGQGQGQVNKADKTHWKTNTPPAPPGWGKTQGQRKGWGDGTVPPGFGKQDARPGWQGGTTPPGFSKGGQVK